MAQQPLYFPPVRRRYNVDDVGVSASLRQKPAPRDARDTAHLSCVTSSAGSHTACSDQRDEDEDEDEDDLMLRDELITLPPVPSGGSSDSSEQQHDASDSTRVPICGDSYRFNPEANRCSEHTCRAIFLTSALLELHLTEKHDAYFQASVDRGKAPLYRCIVPGCPALLWTARQRKNHLIIDHAYTPACCAWLLLGKKTAAAGGVGAGAAGREERVDKRLGASQRVVGHRSSSGSGSSGSGSGSGGGGGNRSERRAAMAQQRRLVEQLQGACSGSGSGCGEGEESFGGGGEAAMCGEVMEGEGEGEGGDAEGTSEEPLNSTGAAAGAGQEALTARQRQRQRQKERKQQQRSVPGKQQQHGAPLCRFFNSPTGCRSGDGCPFVHRRKSAAAGDDGSGSTARTTAVPAGASLECMSDGEDD